MLETKKTGIIKLGVKMKKILFFVVIIIVSLSAASVSAKTIDTNYRYVGFSNNSHIKISQVANEFINDITTKFADEYPANKIGFGFYIFVSNYNYTVVVNTYRAINGGQDIEANEAYTYSETKSYSYARSIGFYQRKVRLVIKHIADRVSASKSVHKNLNGIIR